MYWKESWLTSLFIEKYYMNNKTQPRQNTPLQNAAVLFFNLVCLAPLKLVWCNKARGYKTNKNILDSTLKNLDKDDIFFWLAVKSFPQCSPCFDFLFYLICRTVAFLKCPLLFINMNINSEIFNKKTNWRGLNIFMYLL